MLPCLLLTLTRVTQAAAEKRNEKEFIVDHYWSPYFSSSILSSGRDLLNQAEDSVFRDNMKRKIIGSILNNVFNIFLTVTNHEVYGHGFRLRSLGITASYSIKLLGLRGGTTQYKLHRALAMDEQLLITMGGIEANNVLAQQLLCKNFRKLSLDSRTYALFLKAYLDHLVYVWATHLSERIHNSPGNDIQDYIKEINAKHHAEDMNLDKLVKSSLVFLCNPILYISLWAQLNYGKDTFIPHVKLGDIHYMPLLRMGLTPFGPMYYVDNYMAYNDKTFLLSVSGGHAPYYTRGYGGVQLQTSGLFTYKNYDLDVIGNLWYQPKLQLQANDPIEDKIYCGGLIGIHNKFKLGEHMALSISILYKNAGFVEGVVASSGLIARAGFSLYN